ncbi:unnamed protein product, partial [Nesidiocoris tenuis]
MQRRIGSGGLRYVGEYLPGKQGPGAEIGKGDLPCIILSVLYIIRSITQVGGSARIRIRVAKVKR